MVSTGGEMVLHAVVRECMSIFELLASEDQALLVEWDTPLVAGLRLGVVDGAV